MHAATFTTQVDLICNYHNYTTLIGLDTLQPKFWAGDGEAKLLHPLRIFHFSLQHCWLEQENCTKTARIKNQKH